MATREHDGETSAVTRRAPTPSAEAAPEEALTLALPRAQQGHAPLAQVRAIMRDAARRYEPRELLGRGGMGSVHRCYDPALGRAVAMKRITPQLVENTEVVERFLLEARVQGRLEHPSIIPVHELGVDDRGHPYFTMKTIQGTTLRAVLKALARGDSDTARDYSRRRLLTAFLAVCQAIAYAHSLGVLHRDLKTANIMLGEFGEVYVLDSGIARVGREPESSTELPLLPDLPEKTSTPGARAARGGAEPGRDGLGERAVRPAPDVPLARGDEHRRLRDLARSTRPRARHRARARRALAAARARAARRAHHELRVHARGSAGAASAIGFARTPTTLLLLLTNIALLLVTVVPVAMMRDALGASEAGQTVIAWRLHQLLPELSSATRTWE